DLLLMTALGVGIMAMLNFLYSLALPGIGIMQEGHVGAWRGLYSQKNGLARLMVLGTIACSMAAFELRGRYRLLSGAGALLCLAWLIFTKDRPCSANGTWSDSVQHGCL